jgi:hypothetical protein
MLDQIRATLPPHRLEHPLTHAAIYAHVTVVRSHRLGTAMTVTDDRILAADPSVGFPFGDCSPTPSLASALDWLEATHPLQRSIGVAALNSCLPLEGQQYFVGNAIELTARLGAGKRVVLVGHFPNAGLIAKTASRFDILEKRPQPGDLPAEAACEVVPKADVVAVTGVTCLNDTLEGLLALKRPGAIFIVLGPTVPLSPVLFDFGVDVVGGAWTEDEETVERMLAWGATPRALKGFRFVLMPRSPELVAGFAPVRPPPERSRPGPRESASPAPVQPAPPAVFADPPDEAAAAGFESLADTVFAPLYRHFLGDLTCGLGRGVSGLRVLELGCGPGHMALEFLAAGVSELTLLDWSEPMLERARLRLERASREAWAASGFPRLCQAAVGELPLEDGCVDVVFSRGSIQFWPDLGVALGEVARVLAPGGAAFLGVGLGLSTPPELKARAQSAFEQRVEPSDRARIPRLDPGHVLRLIRGIGGRSRVEAADHGWWLAWWPKGGGPGPARV